MQIGKTADWVAITADAVWVGSTGPDAIHRIDPDTNQEVAQCSVPGEPCAGPAPGFGSLWVPLCCRAGTVKIDLRSNLLTAVLRFGTAEYGITASEDSVWLVVDTRAPWRGSTPTKGRSDRPLKLPTGSCNPRYSEGSVVRVTNAKGAQLTAVGARRRHPDNHSNWPEPTLYSPDRG